MKVHLSRVALVTLRCEDFASPVRTNTRECDLCGWIFNGQHAQKLLRLRYLLQDQLQRIRIGLFSRMREPVAGAIVCQQGIFERSE